MVAMTVELCPWQQHDFGPNIAFYFKIEILVINYTGQNTFEMKQNQKCFFLDYK